ncbi:MAG: DUF4416 family protein [Candidatus Omnitrophica bacterium]|nr:DUF4416 family protein [Candidatus Omnitrophota bacterium]
MFLSFIDRLCAPRKGRPSGALSVKVITGLLSNRMAMFDEVRRILTRAWGPVDIESPLLDFTHTRYYEEEFGPCLKRRLWSFRDLRSREGLYRLKLFTGCVERRLSSADNKRTINIDPGYVSHSKLVLFTTKDYSHRLYQGQGIYAEVTLKYEEKNLVPFPWTYPDYQTKEYGDFFDRVRRRFVEQVKEREA